MIIASLILASLLRLGFLGSIPAGVVPDELIQGYDAYSLYQTGHDHWGEFLPLSFTSFLDQKAPLQTYLMIPFAAILGLTPLAIRLPSALISIASVFVFYLFLKAHFDQKTARVGAFLLAISPWSIAFGRSAVEAGFLILLLPLALLLHHQRRHAWSLLVFVISLLTYHSAKIYVPLILIYLYYPQIKKHLAGFLAVGFLARGNELFFTKLTEGERLNLSYAQAFNPLSMFEPVIGLVLNPEFALHLNELASNYLNYFSINLWFTNGIFQQALPTLPLHSLFYLWQLPLLIFGIVLIFKQPKNIRHLFVFLLLIAPLPAAITEKGTGEPQRVILFLPLLLSLISLGLANLKPIWRRAVIAFSFLPLIFMLNSYAFSESIVYPGRLSAGWQEAVECLTRQNAKEYKIQQGNEPQSFVLFYTRVDPRSAQEASQVWRQEANKRNLKYLDQLDYYQLGNYTFESFQWPDDERPETVYLAHDLKLLPANRQTICEITSPTGNKLLEVFKFNYEE